MVFLSAGRSAQEESHGAHVLIELVTDAAGQEGGLMETVKDQY